MRYYISLLTMAVICLSIFTACQSSAPQPETAAHTEPTAADGIPRISLDAAKKAFDEGNVVFVDTRAETSYKQEHIKGAMNIPMEAFQTRFAEVPKDKKIITYCS